MPVTKYSFTDLVRIEQLRNIETYHGKELNYAGVDDMNNHIHADFEYATFIQRLTSRAKRLIKDNALTNAISRPQKVFTRASQFSLFIAAVLGGLAASQAVGESATLNIYWLLVVLLGFNLLSILLWLFGITFNMHGLSTGFVAYLASWLPYRQKENNTISSRATNAWCETCLTGSVGKWRISVLTHQFWLTYLTSGLIILILLMIARQYNFIWGTTLLPESSIPDFTQFLARPMEYVGLMAPDSNQIATSRIGLGEQDTETRNAWARFILGTILLYGILPRALLLFFSSLMRKLAEKGFKLDLYLPYYIELRQRLMTPDIAARVVDADPHASVQQTHVVLESKTTAIPANALAIGIELDDQMVWPNSVTCYGNVIDQLSHAEAMKSVKTIKGPLLIGVAAHRLPDRGVQRTIRELIDNTAKEPWLLLLHNQSAAPITDKRKIAWFRLAEACGIAAEHVITQ
ncbi:MAG: DUF2868 domain-containing protein [Nitrosomonas sp.]|nr:DUF2868 domain-containing protein [Nitrosomonas sp.]